MLKIIIWWYLNRYYLMIFIRCYFKISYYLNSLLIKFWWCLIVVEMQIRSALVHKRNFSFILIIVITYSWKEVYPHCASLTWRLTLWHEKLCSFRESYDIAINSIYCSMHVMSVMLHEQNIDYIFETNTHCYFSMKY